MKYRVQFSARYASFVHFESCASEWDKVSLNCTLFASSAGALLLVHYTGWELNNNSEIGAVCAVRINSDASHCNSRQ